MSSDLGEFEGGDSQVDSTSPPVAASKNTPWKLLAAAAGFFILGALVASAVFVLVRSEPDPITVAGGMTIVGSKNYENVGSGCQGDGGYSDLSEGASITVTDASGTTVGTGRLEQGDPIRGGRCVFGFSVPGVKGGSEFYGIEIANRGVVTYTADQIMAGASQVQLSIGN